MIKKFIMACLTISFLAGCSTTATIIHAGFVAASPNQTAPEDVEN